MLTLPVIDLSREVTFSGRLAERQTQLRWQLEAGLRLSLYEFLVRHSESDWTIDGTSRSMEAVGRALTVSIEDEFGKIDLNAGSPELLQKLLRVAGETDAEADRLTHAIVQWRTPLRAAESHFDTDSNVARDRHGWFDSVDELQQVDGFSRALVKRLHGSLTVFSPRGNVDVSTAPVMVRQALDAGTSADLGATSDGPARRISSLPSLGGHVFTIRVVIANPPGAGFGLEETVRFVDDRQKGYHVLARREIAPASP